MMVGHPLPEDEAHALRILIQQRGLAAAAIALGLSAGTVASGAAGAKLANVSRLALRAALDAIARTP